MASLLPFSKLSPTSPWHDELASLQNFEQPLMILAPVWAERVKF
jgi:hypothetical protein